MRWLLLATCLLTVSTAWGSPRFASQLTPENDLVVRRMIVPSPEQPHGEVQVIQRDGLVVVQTVLASRLLKRVAAAISAKELKRWPEGSDGYAGSLRYRDELYRAVGEAWQIFRKRQDTSDKFQYLAIEFIVGERYNLIALSLPVLDGPYGKLVVKDKRVVAVWSAPRDYVLANSAVIIADNFDQGEKQAAQWLKGLRQNK